MNPISQHLILPIKNKHARITERGELIVFFVDKLNQSLLEGRKPYSKVQIAVKLSHLTLADLYYLRSTCLDAERRNYPFGKCFWGSLKVKKLSIDVPIAKKIEDAKM